MTGAPFETDAGYGASARLGLIVLSTDETLENEARGVMGAADAALYHARIPAHADVTPETFRLMEDALPQTAALLPQGLDAIGYACTSGATVIGPDRVAALVQGAHPGVPVTTPIDAVVAAMRALDATRIALVTPYVPSVTAPMRAYLETRGIATVAERSFGEKDDWTVARIAEASTLAAMQEAGRTPCDAVFASCTNLRTFGIIEVAEAALGVPVVTSNQALLWHMLRLAGLPTRGLGPGRLFTF